MGPPRALRVPLFVALMACAACYAAASSVAATEATSPVSPQNLRALGTSFSRTIAKSLAQSIEDAGKARTSAYDDLARGGVIKSEGAAGDEDKAPINVYGVEGTGTKKTLGKWFEDLIEGMEKDLSEQDEYHSGKDYHKKEGHEDEYSGDADKHYHGSEKHADEYKEEEPKYEEYQHKEEEPKYEEYQHYEQVSLGVVGPSSVVCGGMSRHGVQGVHSSACACKHGVVAITSQTSVSLHRLQLTPAAARVAPSAPPLLQITTSPSRTTTSSPSTSPSTTAMPQTMSATSSTMSSTRRRTATRASLRRRACRRPCARTARRQLGLEPCASRESWIDNAVSRSDW